MFWTTGNNDDTVTIERAGQRLVALFFFCFTSSHEPTRDGSFFTKLTCEHVKMQRLGPRSLLSDPSSSVSRAALLRCSVFLFLCGVLCCSDLTCHIKVWKHGGVCQECIYKWNNGMTVWLFDGFPRHHRLVPRPTTRVVFRPSGNLTRTDRSRDRDSRRGKGDVTTGGHKTPTTSYLLLCTNRGHCRHSGGKNDCTMFIICMTRAAGTRRRGM